VLSEPGILVQMQGLSCRVSRSTGRAETTGEASPKGARLDAESELTNGPQAEGSGGAAGAAFFAYFLSLLKESRSGFGSEAPDPVVGNRNRLEASGIDR
jgi:hypothetical protein